MLTNFEGIWHTVIIFVIYINTVDISGGRVNVIFNANSNKINHRFYSNLLPSYYPLACI